MKPDPQRKVGPGPLRSVMIKCPKTGQPVSTGISTNNTADLAARYTAMKTECRLCGEVHVWGGVDAFFGED